MANNAQQFISLISKKRNFLIAVYTTLIVQLMVTFGIVYSFRNHPELSQATRRSFLFYLILSIGLILILVLFPMPIWLKLVVFTFFAMVIGAMLHNASFMLPEQLVNQALLGTISIFVSMSILAIVLAANGVDLGWMGMFLFAALVGLLIASLIVMFMDKNKNVKGWQKAILIIGLVLFSVYIVYDTNIMLQRDYKQDFVSAAVDFYLDTINIFTRILALDASS